MGKVSDIIPNELSKTNSFSKYTQMIPIVGPWASGVQRGLSAVDRFAETYENTGKFSPSLKYGMSGISGTSGDPYAYSPKNQGFGRDWWLNAGKIGDMLPSWGGGNVQMGSGYGDLLGLLNRQKQQQPMYYQQPQRMSYNNYGNSMAIPPQVMYSSRLPDGVRTSLR